MIIDIPKQNKFYQANDGKIKGSIFKTFNVDLDREDGKLTLPTRLNLNTSVADQAGLTLSTSIAFFDSRYFARTGGTIYVSSADGVNPSVEMEPDASTGTPTSLDYNDDLIRFNGDLYIVGSSIYKKTGTYDSQWSSVSTSPTDSFHTTCVYAGRLYFSDSTTKVLSMTTADSVSTSGSYTLDISTSRGSMEISTIRSASDGIWIGTVNVSGGRARVYKWDGTTENQVDYTFVIPDSAVKSMVIFEDTPYILTGRGKIMRFNGSYFEEVARFPFYENLKLSYSEVKRNLTWTHDNAITVVGDKIHIAIANPSIDASTGINDSNESYAGIWCYDPEFGLYHKHAFLAESKTSSDVNWQVDLSQIGAIYPAAYDSTLVNFEDAGKFIVGAAYYTDEDSTTYGIFSAKENYEEGNSEGWATYPNLGWLVTTQIQAEQIQESWQDFVLSFKRLENSTDKIVIKAKDNEFDYVDSTITWLSGLIFTTTDSSFATIKTNFEDGIDYEMTVLRGSGGGMCSHIVSIDESGGTYTVTVDEEHTGATGSAKARFERWNKIGEVTDNESLLNFQRFSVGLESTWVQFKIFLIGKGDSPTVERMISVSKPKTFYQ